MSNKNIQNLYQHPYHLVDPSPWPFFASFGCLFFTFGTAMWFHGYTGSTFLVFTGLFCIIFVFYTSQNDFVRYRREWISWIGAQNKIKSTIV